MEMNKPLQNDCFLLKLARFIIESNSCYYADWNSKAKIIKIKSICMFVDKILEQKFQIKKIDTFDEHMKANHFFSISNRRKRQVSITYRCTRIGMLKKCLRYAKLQKQMEETSKIAESKLNSIKQNIKDHILIERLIDQVFELKAVNRNFSQISCRVLFQKQQQSSQDSHTNKIVEQERLMQLSERDINISPLKTKTMDAIPTRYENFDRNDS